MSDKVQANAMSPQNMTRSEIPSTSQNPSGSKRRFGQDLPRLSREKLDTLHAEGRCFHCREIGHGQRNCPELSTMKSPQPTNKAGAISFAKMEELARLEEEADVYVGSLGIIKDNPVTEDFRRFEYLEPDSAPTYVREGGYMPLDDYKRFINYTTLMLGMTRIPGQQTMIKMRETKMCVLDPEGTPTIERTMPQIRDKSRRLPEPIVVQVLISGNPIRALLDTGSMADFLSTTAVNLLRLPKETYDKLLSVQLAVHGSQSKINYGTTVNFRYQTIDCKRRFDVANIDTYDAILGTPFFYEHQVAIRFNPSRVIVGSSVPMHRVHNMVFRAGK